MNFLWSFIITVVTLLPWLAMALAAGLVLSKRTKSMAVGMQALGALGFFGLSFLQWLVLWLLAGHATFDVYRGVSVIFQFLVFVALVIFAAGFCWEKLGTWRTKSVPAVPVK